MSNKYRVIHFINQFFAQIGGEEKADTPFFVSDHVIGPGMAFQNSLGGDFEIVSTFVCGDNYFSENSEKILPEMVDEMKKLKPDILIAGPAFNAGRYGPNCGAICKAAQEYLGIPAVTGMYEENPGVEMYRKNCYIIKTKNSAVGMRTAVPAMTALIKKIMEGSEEPDPEKDGYFAKGIKKNVFVEETGADRAIDMVLDKISGQPYKTEMIMPSFEQIPPAPPVEDIKNAKLALVTDAGVTDKMNTERLESARASKYLSLSIEGMDTMLPDKFCSVHGGFDTTAANKNPNVLVPLDILRRYVRENKIGSLFNTLYSTTGNGTSLKNAQQFGREIAKKLIENQVDAVILTST